MDLLINIFLGVLSGVVVAVGGLGFKKLFTPWLEDRLYKGVVLSGKWTWTRKRFFLNENPKVDSTEKKVSHKLELTIELKQSGYHISGLFNARVTTYTKTGDVDDTYENLYEVRGKVNDNYVVMDYQPLSRSRTGLGAFVLQVKHGGKRLVGSMSFVNEGEMDISTLPDVYLEREKE